MKILAAVDGSSFTKRMLAYLAAHDEWLGANHQYTLIHAVTPVPPSAKRVIDQPTLKDYYADKAEQVFKPIRTFLSKQGIDAKYVTKTGEAADLIVQAAKVGNYDLIILGSHGHGTFKNLVMGSVATKVLSQCDTPTLLIR